LVSGPIVWRAAAGGAGRELEVMGNAGDSGAGVGSPVFVKALSG
jgi:hypothetical protein